MAHAIIRDVHPTCPLNCTRENIRCIIRGLSSGIVGHTREMPTKELHMDGQTDRRVNSHKRRQTVDHERHFLNMNNFDRIFHDHMELLHFTKTYKTHFYKLMKSINCSRQIRNQFIIKCFDRWAST